jgi:hypothetical protein
MLKIKILFLLLIFCAAAINTSAQSDKRIKFKRGESSATVSGGAPRGETAGYLVGASKNQTLIVSIASVENNAVFQIKDLNTGYFLPGAGEYDDASSWEGTIPSKGDYRIIVGSTRGGTEYTLIITIH